MFGGISTGRVLYGTHIHVESSSLKRALTLFCKDVGGGVQRMLQDSG
jgi:hypothetical protein